MGECSYKKCTFVIPHIAGRVEVKTVMPTSVSKAMAAKFCVSWSKSGDAKFHRDCWDIVLKASRCRSKKPELPQMAVEEKVLVKEAAKTAEFFDSWEHVQSEARRVAKLIIKSDHCVAFTGAGISTAAGIGDYRGKDGKWTEMDQQAKNMDSLFKPDDQPPTKRPRVESTESNDQDGSEQEEEDGVPYESLRPTYTHEALVKLMEMGHLKYVISQNGDGLHGLSGIPDEKISELHGNVFIEKCEKCGKRYDRPYYVMDDLGSQYYEELEDYGKTDVKKPKFAMQCEKCGLSHRTGRKCSEKNCKGYLIDSIINFRDRLEDGIFDRAMDNSWKCDLMLCLGSTLTVTPASLLADSIKHPPRHVICNRQPTHLDKGCSSKGKDGKPLGSHVFGDCDKFFREVMTHILPIEEFTTWESQRTSRMQKYDKARTSAK